MTVSPLDADVFRLLGDEARLRVLRLLAHGRLNVGELVRILGLAQSTVSRHLKLLREGGLVAERREGGWTWIELAETEPSGLGACWAGLRRSLDEAADPHGDDARREEVLREREERRVGWGPHAQSPAEPGRSWAAWARALGHVLPPLSVADLGCGVGKLTVEIARWASSVVAVEPDPARLAQAKKAGSAADVQNVRYLEGCLEQLPLDDDAFELSILSQVLHRTPEPAQAVSEAARVVGPGGRVLVLDLLTHDEDWVRDQLGHEWRGFDEEEIQGWCQAAGLADIRLDEVARRRGNPFVVIAASGTKKTGRRGA
jgi:ArsR family transcriptional regulator